MQKSNTIINELREISEVVANLAADQPFIAPKGYFEHLPEQILAYVKAQQEPETNILSSDDKVSDPFSPPQGYFDLLAGNILNRVNAEAAAAEQPDPVSPVLSKINKQLPFTVPDGYFEEMPANVLAGIQAIDFVESELEIISPQLVELKKRPVFTVPEDYFQALPAQILSRVKPKARILPGNFGKQVIRFAAAAAVIGIIATGIFFLNQKNDPALNNTAAFNVSFDSSINTISDAEIRAYVQNNSVTLADPSNAVTADLRQEDMKDMLVEVSDNDIESYLEAYGISKEGLTN